MKITTKMREEKDGRLKVEWRFSCERPAPRGENPRYDLEADMAADYAARTAMQAGKRNPDDDAYIIATRERVGPDHRIVPRMDLLLREDNGDGWPGNMDPHRCRYHGWRGTTNDCAIYAHGLRRVLDVRVTGKRSKRVVVVLGRDLAENKP